MIRMAIGLACATLLVALSASAGQEKPEALDAPDVSDPAPDFELKDSKGKTYRLSDFHGKNVILEFIRSGGW